MLCSIYRMRLQLWCTFVVHYHARGFVSRYIFSLPKFHYCAFPLLDSLQHLFQREEGGGEKRKRKLCVCVVRHNRPLRIAGRTLNPARS